MVPVCSLCSRGRVQVSLFSAPPQMCDNHRAKFPYNRFSTWRILFSLSMQHPHLGTFVPAAEFVESATANGVTPLFFLLYSYALRDSNQRFYAKRVNNFAQTVVLLTHFGTLLSGKTRQIIHMMVNQINHWVRKLCRFSLNKLSERYVERNWIPVEDLLKDNTGSSLFLTKRLCCSNTRKIFLIPEPNKCGGTTRICAEACTITRKTVQSTRFTDLDFWTTLKVLILMKILPPPPLKGSLVNFFRSQ